MMCEFQDENWSRRRTAALSFLSNISLDGTHNDTNYAVFMKRSPSPQKTMGVVCEAKVECRTISQNYGQRVTNDSIQTGAVSEPPSAQIFSGTANKFFCNDLSKSYGSITPFRERTSTAGSDYSSEIRSVHPFKKKLLYQGSVPDEKGHHHFSSNESLGSVVGRSKGGGTILESSDPKEVHFLKQNQLHNYRLKDKRLIITTSNKVPLAVFSHFPYNRNYRCGRESVEMVTKLTSIKPLIDTLSVIPLRFWSFPIYDFTKLEPAR